MYPTDYLSERAKRFKCTPAAIRKAMLRNKFSKKDDTETPPRLVRLNGIGSNVFRPASVSAIQLWYILTRVASAKTGSGDMVIHLEDSVVTLSMIGMVKIKLMLQGAVYEDKLFAVGLFEHSINTDIFKAWVKQTQLPELPKNSVVVMDNAAFHKSSEIGRAHV